jgi:ornithine cyclodeaminase
VHVLADRDVSALVTPERAVTVLTQTLLALASGRFIAPPRAGLALGDIRLAVTAGEMRGEWFGYRSYAGVGAHGDEQVTAVHDLATGRLRGLAVGTLLGPMRAGAIGALAADRLAPSGAVDVGLVGAGRQAYFQLWGLRATRQIRRVTVFARSPEQRSRFAERVAGELGLRVECSSSAEAALGAADIAILATSSPTPVLADEAIEPGRYVATVGPKQVGRSEYSPALADAADLVVTDSPQQLFGYDPPHVLAGTEHARRIVGLADILAGTTAGRTRPDDRVLFCNVGLAGTEAALLEALLPLP